MKFAFTKMELVASVFTCCLLGFLGSTLFGQDSADIKYSVGSWPEKGFGNHRVVLNVTKPGDAVWAHIPWRRRDKNPETKDVRVYDLKTGKRVLNVLPVNITREFGDIVFQPATVPGKYAVYYLPYNPGVTSFDAPGSYFKPAKTAGDYWLKRNGLSEKKSDKKFSVLPKAEVFEIQARTDFDRFDPMEVPTRKSELTVLLKKYPDSKYLLFPESRKNPIRMFDELPLRWIKRGPTYKFIGKPQPGEYYVFQIGVYACDQELKDLKLKFDDLKSKAGKEISSATFTCFNIEGTDSRGQHFIKQLNVPKGDIAALWIGIQIPKEAKGKYKTDILIQPSNAPASKVNVELDVSGPVLADCGDSELWRLSRLRWLNSTIAEDDEILPPFTPLKMEGDSISCLNRKVNFNKMGLPKSIVSNNIELLEKPIEFEVLSSEKPVEWVDLKSKVLKAKKGVIKKEFDARNKTLSFSNNLTMEFDGSLTYRAVLKADKAVDINNVKLTIPLKRAAVPYLMGMGKQGGKRPAKLKWKWDIDRADNMVWLGGVRAGLQLKLGYTHETEFNLKRSGLPEAWYNSGRGKCDISEIGDEVLVEVETGQRKLKANQELVFEFRFLVTPFKEINPNHWDWRVSYPWKKFIEGYNTFHIHHSHAGNRFINYPFLNVEELSKIIKNMNENGKSVDLYYTVRELSNFAAELWVLRSLGNEIIKNSDHLVYLNDQAVLSGTGGGYPWLMEHLVSDYVPAWRKPGLPNNVTDAAIATNGDSRWNNYYLEGLDWLIKKVGFEGLYFDGVTFDRQVMKRTAKVMKRNNPNSRLYLHMGDNYRYLDRRVSSANRDMEFFPFLTYLWVGEYYDYENPPDYWLVEISGLPFGLTSETLNHRDNVNPYRSMIYGMSGRLHKTQPYLWKLWDDFGIKDAEMIGYWDENCPVRSDNENVLATAYRKKDKTLVALANWARKKDRLTAVANPVATPIVIDGKLTPEEWDKAAKITNFIQLGKKRFALQQTQVYITYDKENLYIGFKCIHKSGKIKADEKQRDAKIWKDDSIEFFIQPDISEAAYVQFLGNSAGVFADLLTEDNRWNGQWTYKATVGKGYWEGEVAIPFKSLGMKAPKNGEEIGFNFCRTRQTPSLEHSSWSPVKRDFRHIENFGRIKFSTDKPATRELFGRLSFKPLEPAKVNLNIDWKALGLDPAKVTITAPAIKHFQPQAEFKSGQSITVSPNKGWLLVIQEKQ